jgi:hypothetical protein
MMESHTTRVTTLVLGALTVVLGVWIVIGNTVPTGTFVAERTVGDISPWLKNFWPPTHVSAVEHNPEGRLQQRIVASPISMRVHIPRTFTAMTVAIDAEGIPLGSTVGVEKTLHSGEFVRTDLIPSGTTLSLRDIDQSRRDLQLQFEFPELTRNKPVVVRGVRIRFAR